MRSKIIVLAAADQDALEAKGADVEDKFFDTTESARGRAQYLLTESYRLASESSSRRGYSQVRVNGECVADFFQK